MIEDVEVFTKEDSYLEVCVADKGDVQRYERKSKSPE